MTDNAQFTDDFTTVSSWSSQGGTKCIKATSGQGEYNSNTEDGCSWNAGQLSGTYLYMQMDIVRLCDSGSYIPGPSIRGSTANNAAAGSTGYWISVLGNGMLRLRQAGQTVQDTATGVIAAGDTIRIEERSDGSVYAMRKRSGTWTDVKSFAIVGGPISGGYFGLHSYFPGTPSPTWLVDNMEAGDVQTATNTTITPSAGSLALTGVAPTATVKDLAHISTLVGSATLTGAAPATLLASFLTPPVATLALTGIAPTVSQNATVLRTPNAGSMAFTQIAPTLVRGVVLVPGTGSLTLLGYQSAANGRLIIPNTAVLNFTGNTPNTIKTGFDLRPNTASLTLTGIVSDQILGVDSPPTADAGLTGYAPQVSISGKTIQLPTGALALTGQAGPSIRMDSPRTPLVAALSLTGIAPTVVTGGAFVSLPLATTLAYTGYAPNVVSGDNAYPAPTVGAMTFTGIAPTFSITDSKVPSPSVGALTMTGIAPTVTRTTNASITPVTGQLNLSVNGPTVNGLAGGPGGTNGIIHRRRR